MEPALKRAAALAFVSLAAGCLFPALDGLTSPGDAASDAPTTDAADAAETSNLVWLHTDDFEQGCAQWNKSGADGSFPTTLVHDGGGACMFCCNDATPYCTLDRGTSNPIVTNEPPGTTYRAEAWVREAPNTTTAHPGTLYIREWTGSTYTTSSPNSSSPVDQTWTPLAATLTAEGGVALNLYVSINNFQVGECYVVDDVTIYRVLDGG